MRKNLLTMDILLSKEIKCMLEEEQFRPGDKLPSERELACRFGVQRLTVRGALSLLLQDGTIYAKPKSGYYMAPQRIYQSARNFSIRPAAPESEEALNGRLLAFRKQRADLRLSGKMLLPEDTVIYQITKLYSDHEKPLCISHSYLPEGRYPGLTRTAAAAAPDAGLIAAGKLAAIGKANQKITLVYANQEESNLLSLTPGSPLLKHKGLMYDTAGQLAVFFENLMLIDHFAFIREAIL